jgi:hypothetical protein
MTGERMTPIEVTLPIKTVSESNTRCHWAVKARRAKEQRRAAYLATLAEGNKRGVVIPVDSALTVTLTHIGPRRRDSDAIPASMKAIRDGIADALGRDDGDPLITWNYAQRKGDYAVEVRISSRSEA